MPNIQGVILIDVWANEDLADFFHGIVRQTAGFDIRCCVNASYNLDIANVVNNYSDDHSMSNTFHKHLWNRPLDSQPSTLDSLHPSDRLVYNVMRFSRSQYRSDPILCTPDLLRSDASVVILDPDDFVHHCQMYHDNKIKDWLIIGQAWMMCLHFRPMGLYNLQKLTRLYDFNFYVTPWSVLNAEGKLLSHDQFEDSDSLNWQPIKNFGYRLC